MSDFSVLKDDLSRRMESSLQIVRKEFTGLRTGRASVGLLEPINVEAYGSQMPLSQVASITIPEARLITVQVWDKEQVKAVEKAIRQSDLGLNPSVDGQLIRIQIPPPTEERRNELIKIASKYSEECKVAIRNIRRDGNEQLKKMEKEGHVSKDLQHDYQKEIQDMTDKFIKSIEEYFQQKEEEILKQ